MEKDKEVKDWCIGKENETQHSKEQQKEIINMVRHIWVRCYLCISTTLEQKSIGKENLAENWG
jgi:hypothetical protein